MIIQAVATVVFFGLILLLSGVSVGQVVDIPSIIALLLISIPAYIASGQVKNVFSAIRIITARNKRFTLEELKNAGDALKFLMIILIISSFCITIIGCAGVLRNFDGSEAFFNNFFVAMLPLFYSAVAMLFIIPMVSRITLLQNKAYGEEF